MKKSKFILAGICGLLLVTGCEEVNKEKLVCTLEQDVDGMMTNTEYVVEFDESGNNALKAINTVSTDYKDNDRATTFTTVIEAICEEYNTSTSIECVSSVSGTVVSYTMTLDLTGASENDLIEFGAFTTGYDDTKKTMEDLTYTCE